MPTTLANRCQILLLTLIMITRVSHITLLVKNQDEALAFYKDKLGFKIHTDAMFGDSRWLTICTDDAPNFEIAVALAAPGDIELVGKQAGSYPLWGFETKDCIGTYNALKAKGVQFDGEPKVESWGTGASFKDLYGNMIYITQPS
jgi:catechol 2,3-dioxygenase-like lactoylglutathione lyase family enzyme